MLGMEKIMKKLLTTLSFLLGFSASLYAANTMMYIQSTKASLQSAPSFGSSSLLSLEKGAQVEVIEIKGRWVKIKTGTQEGWVSKFLVSEQPPLKKKVTILKEDAPDMDNARRRASAVTTAGAARGLSADNRDRSNDSQFTNYRDLEKVEKMDINEKELEKFIQEKRK
jgi:uncharacterized protein YgiM (DUF1202 family)